MRAHINNPRGDALVEELKWVHDHIRRDLSTVRRLADQAAAGAAPASIAAGVRSLQASGPLWTLRVNCLAYCRVVHMHHSIESAMLFPALRRANPELGAVIDKLQADHDVVSGQLDEITAACQELSTDDSQEARQRVVTALTTLAADLLAHLDFEEEQISPTLRTLTAWPI